jgi:hypothetical protein
VKQPSQCKFNGFTMEKQSGKCITGIGVVTDCKKKVHTTGCLARGHDKFQDDRERKLTRLLPKGPWVVCCEQGLSPAVQVSGLQSKCRSALCTNGQ